MATIWQPGMKITADRLNNIVGPWTSYTPVWSSTGTAVSLGNGSIWGRYVQFGSTCIALIEMVCGSTTTFGSGTYSWTLPLLSANPSDGDSNWSAGTGAARAHNATSWWTGTSSVPKNSTAMRIYSHSAGAEWGPSQPFTWTALTSNYFTAEITYQTA